MVGSYTLTLHCMLYRPYSYMYHGPYCIRYCKTLYSLKV